MPREVRQAIRPMPLNNIEPPPCLESGASSQAALPVLVASEGLHDTRDHLSPLVVVRGIGLVYSFPKSAK